jgi:hypothetical protein
MRDPRPYLVPVCVIRRKAEIAVQPIGINLTIQAAGQAARRIDEMTDAPADRLERVRREISDACTAAGRDPA